MPEITVTERQRQAYVMKLGRDITDDEAAQQMGMSQPAFTKLYNRAVVGVDALKRYALAVGGDPCRVDDFLRTTILT